MSKSSKKTRLAHHFWTKVEIKKVLKLWENSESQDIADELGVEKSQIVSLVYELRKAGFKLSRKRRKGYLQPLLAELKKELKLK